MSGEGEDRSRGQEGLARGMERRGPRSQGCTGKRQETDAHPAPSGLRWAPARAQICRHVGALISRGAGEPFTPFLLS